jgi:hypothetical protein
MNQHLQRFNNASGINQIDRKILNIINSDNLTKRTIIRDLLNWQRKETVYGFGDIQYAKYLEKLHRFYDLENDLYKLNAHGKSFLEST